MIDQLNPSARQDKYGTKINRDHSPILVYGIPWITIIFASLTPILPVIASSPIIPPLGYLFFIGWQISRPGLLPFWSGIPLGLWYDLFSGQPIGSAIMLWSLSLLALEVVEFRFPWRVFWQDWLTATALIGVYVVASMIIAGVFPGLLLLKLAVPLIILSIMVYPMIALLISFLDRIRLLRLRVIS